MKRYKQRALRGEMVSNKLLRSAAEESGIPWVRIAVRAEMDHAQLRVALGRKPYYKKRGQKKYGPYWREGITPRNARRIAEAIGLDPVELDF